VRRYAVGRAGEPSERGGVVRPVQRAQFCDLRKSPAKTSLLWTAELVLGEKQIEEMRAHFDHVLDNPLLLNSFPGYISGFVIALDFTAMVNAFAVELLSKAFEKLTDAILMPWLPKLLMTLRRDGGDLMPKIIKEAALQLPGDLSALDSWLPHWYQESAAAPEIAEFAALAAEPLAIQTLLRDWRDSANAHAALLGQPCDWTDAVANSAPADSPVRELLQRFPDPVQARAALLL
jgi:hypothetical protein